MKWQNLLGLDIRYAERRLREEHGMEPEYINDEPFEFLVLPRQGVEMSTSEGRVNGIKFMLREWDEYNSASPDIVPFGIGANDTHDDVASKLMHPAEERAGGMFVDIRQSGGAAFFDREDHRIHVQFAPDNRADIVTMVPLRRQS